MLCCDTSPALDDTKIGSPPIVKWDGIPENELHMSHLAKYIGTPETVRPTIPLA